MKNSTPIDARKLAYCIAASAIHQISTNAEKLDKEAKETGVESLLDILAEEALSVANDILEVCEKDPYLFFTMVMAGVTSIMVNIANKIPGEQL